MPCWYILRLKVIAGGMAGRTGGGRALAGGSRVEAEDLHIAAHRERLLEDLPRADAP